MFWYMDLNRDFRYRFVLDTFDNSIQFVDVTKLVDVQILGYKGYNLYSSNSAKWSKLKYIGFIESESKYLTKELCKYSIAGLPVSLSLYISQIGQTMIILGSFLSKPSLNKRYDLQMFMIMSKNVYLSVPCPMIDWILNLYSKHDFEGLMDSFSGLFGRHLGKVIDFFDEDCNVSGLEWK